HNEWDKAETVYLELIKTHPKEPQVWLSYADNFRAQNKDQQAVEVLDRGLKSVPDNAAMHYSKSLTLVRLEDKSAAANEIEVAAKLAKDNSYYWYLNGVLQEELDIDKSTQSFEKAYLISGSPEQLYA
ncbi:tetratricopeptide repeat protein, partial [Vibrio sp. 10N.261.48.A2]